MAGIILLSLSARNAGFADFFGDARMQEAMLYLARLSTPPPIRPSAGSGAFPRLATPTGAGTQGLVRVRGGRQEWILPGGEAAPAGPASAAP